LFSHIDLFLVICCKHLYESSLDILGWCTGSCSSLTLPNNLFFTQIIKQSINYVFSSIIHHCLPIFGQVFNPTLEEIFQFGHQEAMEPILELSVVEGNSAQIVGERAKEVRRVGRMWNNLPVEFLNGHFAVCGWELSC
jgi:hypothetical protein